MCRQVYLKDLTSPITVLPLRNLTFWNAVSSILESTARGGTVSASTPQVMYLKYHLTSMLCNFNICFICIYLFLFSCFSIFFPFFPPISLKVLPCALEDLFTQLLGFFFYSSPLTGPPCVLEQRVLSVSTKGMGRIGLGIFKFCLYSDTSTRCSSLPAVFFSFVSILFH